MDNTQSPKTKALLDSQTIASFVTLMPWSTPIPLQVTFAPVCTYMFAFWWYVDKTFSFLLQF